RLTPPAGIADAMASTHPACAVSHAQPLGRLKPNLRLRSLDLRPLDALRGAVEVRRGQPEHAARDAEQELREIGVVAARHGEAGAASAGSGSGSGSALGGASSCTAALAPSPVGGRAGVAAAGTPRRPGTRRLAAAAGGSSSPARVPSA